jgi:nitrogen fixation/metabolism regulation signal transduction histidine kinase
MAKELKIAKDEIESKSRSLEFVLNNVAAGIISTDKRGPSFSRTTPRASYSASRGRNWRGCP